MKNVLVVYESRSGNVKEIAEIIHNCFVTMDISSRMLSVNEISNNDLLEADAIVVGSFTSYGIVASGIKEMFDNSIKVHGKLQNKIGAAFCSSGELGGGNELTVLSIIQMMLVHGMIIAGSSSAPHFGVVSVGKPNEKVNKACVKLANRVKYLLDRLA